MGQESTARRYEPKPSEDPSPDSVSPPAPPPVPLLFAPMSPAGDAPYRSLMDLASEGLCRFEFSPPLAITLNERDLAEAILDRSALAECNRAFAQDHACDRPEEMIGASPAEIWPGSREDQSATVIAFIRSEFRLQDRLVPDHDHPAGERLLLHTMQGNVKDGFLTGFWCAQRDVTEAHRLERVLSESEETMRVLIQAIPEPALLMTIDGEVLVANPAMSLILGVPLEDLLGHCVYDTMPEELAQLRRRNVAEVVATARPGRWEDNDGDRRYLNHVYPVSDATGRPVRVAVCAVDITERKGTEERLVSLAAAVEQAADDIVLFDADGKIQYVNPAFERTTGFTLEEVVGKRGRVLDSGEQTAEAYAEIQETLQAGRTWKGRFSNRTKDGRVILQDASISPIRDAAGRVAGYVSERRDVTREVEMERRAAQADKLQAMGTLAGGIAHDFNNILSAIVGFAQMAQMRTPKDARIQHNLEGILRASSRATDLVRQILTFSRKTEAAGRPVQVGLIVKEAAKFLRASIPTTIDIQCDVRSRAVVLADPTELHRVVVNLCTNATLAMQEKAGVLQMALDDVEADETLLAHHPDLRPGPQVRLTVTDDGCGMPPDVRARIFEPFFTTRDKDTGTGMGLAVVHGIVQNCGGAIDVHSQPGEGTTFEVYLPVVAGTSDKILDGSRELVHGAGRVFIVDDEEIVTRVTSEVLQEAGYSVRAFPNAQEALAAFEADPDAVDVVVTDMTMPGMTGDELTARLKAARPDLPVILCTGYSRKISAEGAASLGVDKFFLKPVDMFELARVIGQLIEKS